MKAGNTVLAAATIYSELGSTHFTSTYCS